MLGLADALTLPNVPPSANRGSRSLSPKGRHPPRHRLQLLPPPPSLSELGPPGIARAPRCPKRLLSTISSRLVDGLHLTRCGRCQVQLSAFRTNLVQNTQIPKYPSTQIPKYPVAPEISFTYLTKITTGNLRLPASTICCSRHPASTLAPECSGLTRYRPTCNPPAPSPFHHGRDLFWNALRTNSFQTGLFFQTPIVHRGSPSPSPVSGLTAPTQSNCSGVLRRLRKRPPFRRRL